MATKGSCNHFLPIRQFIFWRAAVDITLMCVCVRACVCWREEIVLSICVLAACMEGIQTHILTVLFLWGLLSTDNLTEHLTHPTFTHVGCVNVHMTVIMYWFISLCIYLADRGLDFPMGFFFLVFLHWCHTNPDFLVSSLTKEYSS